MATQQEIEAWANAIGLPVCVGQLYANENGGNLPPTLDALDAWGNATCRRVNGVWNCNPQPCGGGTQPPGTQPPGTQPPATGPTADAFGRIIGWVQTHPMETGLGVLAFFLLSKKR